ncbi:MAG: DUF4954 family protein [Spirochaetaceae bacterium]
MIHTISYSEFTARYRRLAETMALLDNTTRRSAHEDETDDNKDYRPLTKEEIEILEHRGSTAQDWSNISVKEGFDPAKISRCRFYGHLRIGKLDDIALQAGAVALPVGINESTLVNCRIGDNAAIYRVSWLSGYIIGNNTLIKDVSELSVSDNPSFGEAALAVDTLDQEKSAIEVVNENGRRAIHPFSGMQTADAHLWAKERGRAGLMKKLTEFTQHRIETRRDDPATPWPFGRIGAKTLIDGLVHGRDIIIGDCAVVEGPLALIDVTLNSSCTAATTIGRGVELSHGLAGCGCSIHTGAKASHFVCADYTTLSLGARVSHTYLGENSTISCCEVAHSLILPFHEQHHNSSFLIAALVEGESNIAAGATLGSNHSSRKAEGEILCRRGFWPGLTASITHPSFFSSFTLLTKQDYPNEMTIPLPFSLVSRSSTDGGLVILPAFWLIYNRYALERNSRKFRRRDRRTGKSSPPLVYEALAPDTANEIADAMELLAEWTLEAWTAELGEEKLPKTLKTPQMSRKDKGGRLLEDYPEKCGTLRIRRRGIENSKIPTRILKVPQAYKAYRKALHLYAVSTIENEPNLAEKLLEEIDSSTLKMSWTNLGGTLFPEEEKNTLIEDIEKGNLSSWDEIHRRYGEITERYHIDIIKHALLLLTRIGALPKGPIPWKKLHSDAQTERRELREAVKAGREKDFADEFRSITFADTREKDAVLGTLEEDELLKHLDSL